MPDIAPSPAYDRVIRSIDRAVAVLAGLAAGVMTLLVAAEVAARYVFSVSIPFSNELSRVLFIWTIFLGLPLALSRGRHVAIGLLDETLPKAWAQIALRASLLASLFLLGVVFFKSAELTGRNWDQMLNTLPVSAGVFYLPIPVGIAIAMLYLLVMAVAGVRELIPGENTEAH
jgi:TRAP-type C4-dicarboxylate transport system permease small subunit